MGKEITKSRLEGYYLPTKELELFANSYQQKSGGIYMGLEEQMGKTQI
jgi:hypothetical protein